MKKTVEVTITHEIKIDENHPEFEEFIKDYDKDTSYGDNLSAIDKMINHAVSYKFSKVLPVIENGILQLIETINDTEIEILG